MTELPLTIKEHPRAKNVLVKLVPGRGLEVVVPRGYDRTQVPGVLQRKQGWIERTRRLMEADGIQLMRNEELPERILFRCIDVERRVDYLRKNAKVRITENGTRLLISGDMKDRDAVMTVLKRYVAGQARLHLPSRLAETSRRTGLEYADTRIRTQKTRWGSCSSRGSISLNAKLLFLPAELVEQLFVHELCHRKHMNHSPAYWRLVASHQPDYRRLEEELKNGNRFVPGWMLA